MKLDCILTACNDNPLYMDFIPIFIKAWNKLYSSVDVKIIFVGDNIPEKFQEYKNYIIFFKPTPNMSTAFIAQYIRLLYPAILNYENGIMITDMDMLPMNKTYYTKNIEHIGNDKFIYLRQVLLNDFKQIAMCYNVALNKTWKEIFNIHSLEDIQDRLVDVYSKITYAGGPGNEGWSTDQIDLYNLIMKWNSATKNFITLPDHATGFRRLDRGTFHLTDKIGHDIHSGFFSDYHTYRPYSQYKTINDTILTFLQ